MAENDVGGDLFRVIVHFNGTFVRHPCGYVGECYQLIEDRIGEPVEKLYYCVPGMPLSTGIRFIEDDLDTGEENGEIAVYADNSGMTLDEWWDENMNLVVSDDESGLEDDDTTANGTNQGAIDGGNGNGQSQPQGGNGNGQSQPQGPVDEIEHDDIIPMDKTKDDAFLSKLCPSAVDRHFLFKNLRPGFESDHDTLSIGGFGSLQSHPTGRRTQLPLLHRLEPDEFDILIEKGS
ncbi:hypothetical protein LXL04_027871 [Taraxacum kok-saghyz]